MAVFNAVNVDAALTLHMALLRLVRAAIRAQPQRFTLASAVGKRAANLETWLQMFPAFRMAGSVGIADFLSALQCRNVADDELRIWPSRDADLIQPRLAVDAAVDFHL